MSIAAPVDVIRSVGTDFCLLSGLLRALPLVEQAPFASAFANLLCRAARDDGAATAQCLGALLGCELHEQLSRTPGRVDGYLRGNTTAALLVDRLLTVAVPVGLFDGPCAPAVVPTPDAPASPLRAELCGHGLSVFARLSRHEVADLTVADVLEAANSVAAAAVLVLTEVAASLPQWPLFLRTALAVVAAAAEEACKGEAARLVLTTAVLLRTVGPLMMQRGGGLAAVARAMLKVANRLPVLAPFTASPREGEDEHGLVEAIDTANTRIADQVHPHVVALLEQLRTPPVGGGDVALHSAPLDEVDDGCGAVVDILLRHVPAVAAAMGVTDPHCAELHAMRILGVLGYVRLREGGPLQALRVRAASTGSSHSLGSGWVTPEFITNESGVDGAKAALHAAAGTAWEALVRYGCRAMREPVLSPHAHQFVTLLGGTQAAVTVVIHGDLLLASERFLLADPEKSEAVLARHLPQHAGVQPLDGELAAHLAVFLSFVVEHTAADMDIVCFPTHDTLRPHFGYVWLRSVLSRGSTVVPPSVIDRCRRLIFCRPPSLRARGSMLWGKVAGAVKANLTSVASILEADAPEPTAPSPAPSPTHANGQALAPARQGPEVLYTPDPQDVLAAVQPHGGASCNLPLDAALQAIPAQRSGSQDSAEGRPPTDQHILRVDAARRLLYAIHSVVGPANVLLMRPALSESFRSDSAGTLADRKGAAAKGLLPSAGMLPVACGAYVCGYLDEEATPPQRLALDDVAAFLQQRWSMGRPPVGIKALPLRTSWRCFVGVFHGAVGDRPKLSAVPSPLNDSTSPADLLVLALVHHFGLLGSIGTPHEKLLVGTAAALGCAPEDPPERSQQALLVAAHHRGSLALFLSGAPRLVTRISAMLEGPPKSL